MTHLPQSPVSQRDGFDVDPDRGFVPAVDPLRRLPERYAVWEEIAADLPKLLITDHLRATLDGLAPLPSEGLGTERELERAMLVLSYLGHAYVWGAGGGVPPERLPAGIAVPWHAVAERVGRPPVLSYASYALHNWRRIDPQGPVALGNIALLQNFLGGMDEEWFILVHVDIEAKAGAALRELLPLRAAATAGDTAATASHLRCLAEALEAMYGVLLRMPEGCDPYIYFNRVRPYIHGWKNHPALPLGLVYEGVDAYGGAPQQFRGETGAQSSIIPAIDAALGVEHQDDPLRTFLMEMREYMPPAHRRFLAELEREAPVRALVLAHDDDTVLRDAYNRCTESVERFRAKHLEYAAFYIQKQSQAALANPNAVGTGGTPFMQYLKKHRDETSQHRVGARETTSAS